MYDNTLKNIACCIAPLCSGIEHKCLHAGFMFSCILQSLNASQWLSKEVRLAKFINTMWTFCFPRVYFTKQCTHNQPASAIPSMAKPERTQQCYVTLERKCEKCVKYVPGRWIGGKLMRPTSCLVVGGKLMRSTTCLVGNQMEGHPRSGLLMML